VDALCDNLRRRGIKFRLETIPVETSSSSSSSFSSSSLEDAIKRFPLGKKKKKKKSDEHAEQNAGEDLVRCFVHFGDNRTVRSIEGVADRVLLGLLPPRAKPVGTLQREPSREREADLSVHHVEIVKSFAPKVLHLVVDVECRPPP